jgi:hypothetical protein
MRQKIIATGAGLVFVGLATVGAFAAQHATTSTVPVPTDTVTDTATVTDTVTDTSTPDVTQTDTPTDTPTDTTTGTPTDTPAPSDTDTPTPEPSGTATSEATSTSESGGQRDIKGIPEDNPGRGHRDGLCIKTTPSGNQVRVPCHAHGAATASATPTP